jgi:hypothetical protein
MCWSEWQCREAGSVVVSCESGAEHNGSGSRLFSRPITLLTVSPRAICLEQFASSGRISSGVFGNRIAEAVADTAYGFDQVGVFTKLLPQ